MKRKIYILTGDSREGDSHEILYAGFCIGNARKEVVKYLARYEVGEGCYWRSRKKFDENLKEKGYKKFVECYMSGWLRSPCWMEKFITT